MTLCDEFVAGILLYTLLPIFVNRKSPKLSDISLGLVITEPST